MEFKYNYFFRVLYLFFYAFINIIPRGVHSLHLIEGPIAQKWLRTMQVVLSRIILIILAQLSFIWLQMYKNNSFSP